jgi:hypothetical protein
MCLSDILTQQTFSIKRQIVNVLGFSGQSIVSSQLYIYSMKAMRDNNVNK